MIRLWFFLALGFFIGTVIFFVKKDQIVGKPKLVSPFSSLAIETTFWLPSTEKPSKLGLAVARALDKSQGTYSVVIKNLKTGEQYNYNENYVYGSGSLYKLWVMAATMQKVESGQWTLDDEKSDSVENLNNYFGLSDDVAELTDGYVDMTVHQALTQIAAISHNYAAMLLSKNLGADAVKQEMVEIGLSQSSFKQPPQTTANDTAIFFEKLYKSQVVDATASAKIVKYLKGNTFDQGMTKYLPKGVDVSHKTGEIDGFKHDGGIVYSPAGDYLLVVLSNSDNPLGAQERIAQISKEVYRYFNEN